ncbi:MAG: hypothetical protein HFF80_01585 [Oscillospiraceae bacterium]|jgi:DNA-directed RNA polymerase subunit RPC12/RpoP|nr:hypothetical protein [Oscillospiraceae bacterium]
MEHGLRCLRCGGEMRFACMENLQLGKTSFLLGVWPNLLAGAMRVGVYCCQDCGKLEFFAAGGEEHSSVLPQTNCPACGRRYDFDYPRCPFCGYEY